MAEEGTHDELMKKGGLYAGLYQKQSLNVIGGVETPVETSHAGKEEAEEMKEAMFVSDAPFDEDDIPDEIPESKMRHMYLLSVLKKTHTSSLFFWIGMISTAFRVIFPPLYSYAASILQEVLYDFGIASRRSSHVDLTHF